MTRSFAGGGKLKLQPIAGGADDSAGASGQLTTPKSPRWLPHWAHPSPNCMCYEYTAKPSPPKYPNLGTQTTRAPCEPRAHFGGNSQPGIWIGKDLFAIISHHLVQNLPSCSHESHHQEVEHGRDMALGYLRGRRLRHLPGSL